MPLVKECEDPPPFVGLKRHVNRANSKRRRRYLALGFTVGERLSEHDFETAAEVAAVLAGAFTSRSSYEYPTSFPREVTWALVDALKVAGGPREGDDAESPSARESRRTSDRELLIKVLRTVQSAELLHAASGGARNLQAAVGLELMSLQCQQGEALEAFEEQHKLRLLDEYKDCALFQAGVGGLAMLVAQQPGPECSPQVGYRSKTELVKLAKDCFQRALGIRPSTHMYAYLLANAMELLDEGDEALEELKNFSAANPEDPHVREDILRRDPNDLETAKELAKLNPYSANAREVLSRVGDPVDLAHMMSDLIDVGDQTAWLELAKLLEKDSPTIEREVWFETGRFRWWPNYHMHPKRASYDLSKNVDVAIAKATVNRSWARTRNVSYAKEVEKQLQEREFEESIRESKESQEEPAMLDGIDSPPESRKLSSSQSSSSQSTAETVDMI